MQKATNCLNCKTTFLGNYCPQCGQKATTSRFTLKKIFSVGFIKGTFHLNKGFLYTTKILFTKPGSSLREYLKGSRAKHFNFATYTLIIIAIYYFTKQITGYNLSMIYNESDEEMRTMMAQMDNLISSNYKLFALLTIPLYSVFTYMIFRPPKLYFAEHLIINTYRYAAEMIISLPFLIVILIEVDFNVLSTIFYVFSFFGIIYSTWFMYDLFKVYYRKKWMPLVLSVFFSIGSQIVLGLLLGLATGITEGIKEAIPNG